MTQHALLLSRSEDALSTSNLASSSTSPSDAAPYQGILLTLTLDAAQVSAVVSAVQAETTPGTSDTDKTFSQHRTNIKLVNPKTASSSATRHSISFSATAGASVDHDDAGSSVRGPAVPASRTQSSNSNASAEIPLFSMSSGGVKAVVTRSSSSAIEEARPTSSAASNSSNTEPNAEESSASPPAQSNTASVANSASSLSLSSSSSSSSLQSSLSTGHSSSPVATSSRASSTTRSNTRVAVTSIVAKPVITNPNGVPVVTVYETTGTAFVTASTPSSPSSKPTGGADSKKNFFQTIDSSPTAKALTAIISALIILLIGLAIWFCMRRRSRRPKRRDSLFDFAPDATNVKSAASSYSEKTPIVAAAAAFAGTGAAYPFSGDQASFGYDSRYVEAATSTPARSPQQAEEEYRASTSAVRFAGIYPTITSERRKSSVDLGQVYRLASDYRPQESRQDNLINMEGSPNMSTRDIPTVIVPGSSSPASQQDNWGQAHIESPLAVPPRPARPASLSGSITKNIDEMYNAASPRSSMSVLPPVSRPWMRQARKWASMSSMGGGGPDRRPSVDRRLYQQQLPSRFSITTFATSVEASPDLGAFRPRRTAITEQHLGNSMLRTDIFKATTTQAAIRDANPFSDLAQVAPEHAPVDTPSPMSLSEPWAVTAPLNVQSSALQNEIKEDSSSSASASERGSPSEDKLSHSQEAASEEGSFEDSLETASQASAIDEEEEENIRALIKRRQSASSGKML